MKDLIFLIGAGTVAIVSSLVVVGGYYYWMWGYLPWWPEENRKV